MNNIIKCPICGKNSAMRYNEKSIYESRCLYSECREVITVTAKSEVAAKELFAKFGSTNHPKLSIPKKIADKLDNEDANSKAVLDWVFATEMTVVNNEKALERREDEILKRRAIVSIYGASKALGVELVEVTDE